MSTKTNTNPRTLSDQAQRAMRKAADQGGYAGHPAATPLWHLSKRELVELTLRLADQLGYRYAPDDAASTLARAVLNELEVLKENRIL